MKKLNSALVLAWCINGISQEVVSLESLVDSAQERNADLRKLQLEINKARKMNGAFNGVGKTSVNYMHGQIDGPDIDYQWQITQPLGNPLSGIANTQVRQARIESYQLEYALNRAWILMEVQKAYAGWQTWFRIREIRNQIKETYEQALRVAEKQHTLGDIDRTEVGFARGRYAEALQEENTALQQELSFVYQLEVIVQSSLQGKIPAKLSIPSSGSKVEPDSTGLLNEYYESRVNLARENKELSGSRFFPSFSVGYFSQQLGGIPEFDGVTLGASIPLFDVSTYQERQLAKITLEQSQVEAEQNKWQRNSRYQQLLIQQTQIIRQLENLRSDSEETTDNLNIIKRKYELGEIDMLTMSQTISALGAAEISRSQLLLRLEQIKAELNYLNSK